MATQLERCEARQLDESAVLSAMFADDCTLHTSASRSASGATLTVRSDSHSAQLEVAYPALYPEEEAAALELSCPTLDAHHLNRIRSSLEQLASESIGEECVAALAQQLGERLSETATVAPVASAVEEALDGVETLEEMVLRIDHMNQPKRYMQALEGWAVQYRLGVRLFYTGTHTSLDAVVELPPSSGNAF